jgi:hypothetical protein
MRRLWCMLSWPTSKGRKDLHEHQPMERHDTTRYYGGASAHQGCLSRRDLSSRGGGRPYRLYLDAYTDAEDAFTVLDLVSDWLVDLSVNAGVHLHVIPLPQKAAPHVRIQ